MTNSNNEFILRPAPFVCICKQTGIKTDQICIRKGKNHWGKVENAGYQNFLPFTQSFPKPSHKNLGFSDNK